MSPKEIRTAARRSRAWVAAIAGVSEPTARLLEEAGPHAVTERSRVALEPVYRRLAAELNAAPSSGPEVA